MTRTLTEQEKAERIRARGDKRYREKLAQRRARSAPQRAAFAAVLDGLKGVDAFTRSEVAAALVAAARVFDDRGLLKDEPCKRREGVERVRVCFNGRDELVRVHALKDRLRASE